MIAYFQRQQISVSAYAPYLFLSKSALIIEQTLIYGRELQRLWLLPQSGKEEVMLLMLWYVYSINSSYYRLIWCKPNLVDPIITVARALEYRSSLEKAEPNVKYLMSLYLHPTITPETIVEAKKAGITGVKSYPAGVTTHSDSGVGQYLTSE